MKEVTVKIYEFDELDKDIQEEVIKKWRYDDYFEATDEERTLEVFSKMIGVHVNYEYGNYRDYINFTSNIDDDILELSGIRLMKYVANNYFDEIHEGKYYSTGRIVKNKYVGRNKMSKVIFDRECPLTGFCFDIDILETMYEVMDGKYVTDKNFTFNKMIQKCLENWLKSVTTEYEHWFSEECIREEIEINEYMFTEDGEIFKR